MGFAIDLTGEVDFLTVLDLDTRSVLIGEVDCFFGEFEGDTLFITTSLLLLLVGDFEPCLALETDRYLTVDSA